MRKPWREEQLSVVVSRRIKRRWRVGLTSNATDLLNDAVDHLLADGVVTTGICSCQYLCIPMASQDAQLLAASSLPLINSSGWNSWR
jgi:preprotein translocase subunit SecF